MLNSGRYNKIDYTGFLGSFIASWILHCAFFVIAATTTIFYPPTANREYISVDLMFASPSSQPAGLPLQQIQANSPPRLSADHQSAVEDSDDSPEPVMSAHADSDLELVKVTAPVSETKQIVPARKSPPPIIAKKPVQKINPPPLPESVIIPAVEKAPEAAKMETVKPASPELSPPADMAIQSKNLAQTEQEKLAIEHEKIRREEEAERKAAHIKADEEAQAEERAKVAERERQEAAKAARAEKERIHKQELAEQQAAAEKVREEARQEAIAKAAVLQRQQAENAARAKLAAEKARMKREAAEIARREEQARLKLAAEKAAREQMTKERAAAEKATREAIPKARLAAVHKQEASAALLTPTHNGRSGSTAGAQTAAASAEHREKPLSGAPTVATENNQLKNRPERKGFALPPVAGDIKLLITSAEDLVVKALFVSHPRGNHDKPLSKKEAKAQQKLTPIVVRTAENSLEAVIERSHDGIYIFLVEPKGNKPVQAKCSLKLFETKSKAVKSREISSQTEVARLLMPEGILWEDDSAFSGNIEDSDSVTKFNADSGLVWKEYRR